MKILNYGSMNIDNVYQVEHMIRPGETQMAIAKNVFAGGKGLNQSIAIAKAGGTVYHAGVVGEDGAILMDTLAKHGVDTRYVKHAAGPSGHTVIQVDSIYAKRWNIEVFFRSCNQNLAFDKCQLRKKQGITRMWLILSFIYFLCCTVSRCVGSFDEGYNYFRNCVLQEIFAQNALSM